MVLPQMLAMLGLLFNEAGVGTALARVTTTYINLDFKLVAVMVYVLGHGAVHGDHGERLRRVPGDDRWCRRAGTASASPAATPR